MSCWSGFTNRRKSREVAKNYRRNILVEKGADRHLVGQREVCRVEHLCTEGHDMGANRHNVKRGSMSIGRTMVPRGTCFLNFILFVLFLVVVVEPSCSSISN